MPHAPRMISRESLCRKRVIWFAFVSFAIALLALSVGAASATAMSVVEYRIVLREIRDEAADLTEATPARAAEVAEAIDSALPSDETVDLDGSRIPVRDKKLLELAGRLGSARSSSGIRIAADEVEARAIALLEAIGTGRVVEVPEDREALATILEADDDDEGTTLGDLLIDLAERLADWLEGLFAGLPGVNAPEAPDIDLSGAWPYIVALSAAVAAGLLVRLGMWVMARRRMRAVVAAEEDGAPVVAAAEDLPPDALAYADRLAGAGRFREAVRALFGGAARTLVDVGAIARTKTRTNGELLNDVRTSAPGVVSDLDGLARIFESAWYGRRDPGKAGLDLARTHYLAITDGAGRWKGGDA
ncbi:MAG: DUF4129 domain-containing protein [Coriobacteriia bacterium]|nr:DUF4129 domain-containing protein [Coriobacteriia bacterium]